MLSDRFSALMGKEVAAENRFGVHQQIQQNMLWKYDKSLTNANPKQEIV